MAIDRTGINSLDAGAPNLRLEGDIASIQAIPIELQKIILQYWIQQGDGSSADRIEDVPKEFRDNIIQLFRQQSSAQGGMEPMSAAQGGRAGFKRGRVVEPGGYGGEWADDDFSWAEPSYDDHPESFSDTSSSSSNETTDAGISYETDLATDSLADFIGYGEGKIDPGLAAAAGIGPAASGFVGTTDVGTGDARLNTPPITPVTGDGGNGGDTTNAPVVTGGAAGPTGEVLKRDPYLDPNLMAASIPFETKNLEKLQFGPELDDMARRYVSADGGRIGYGLGDIVRRDRAKFGMPISYNNDEDLILSRQLKKHLKLLRKLRRVI